MLFRVCLSPKSRGGPLADQAACLQGAAALQKRKKSRCSQVERQGASTQIDVRAVRNVRERCLRRRYSFTKCLPSTLVLDALPPSVTTMRCRSGDADAGDGEGARGGARAALPARVQHRLRCGEAPARLPQVSQGVHDWCSEIFRCSQCCFKHLL